MHSALCQSGIDFEIIIADDGSEEDCREKIENFFQEMAWERYLFVKSEKNQGTVKNILNALDFVSGEYIYLTSPGDLLYDAYVMRDFYAFAKEKQCDICFGNAVYYKPGEGKVVSVIREPARISLYHRDVSRMRKQLGIFCDSILGASFFRTKEAAEKYIGGIAHVSKYVEDYTSTCYAVLDGADICHYDRTMLFYEYETGISASKDTVWQERLELDYMGVFRFLREKYPGNPVLDWAYLYKKCKCLWLGRLYKICKHPWVFVNACINKSYLVVKSDCTKELQKKLDDHIKL